jgi:uncharacterized protein (DUF362 family)/MoaA/NifB/PqqE/SkfB family radical SAM enzyme
MVPVAAIQCEDYNRVAEAVRKAVKELGGIERFVKKGDTILLKPNLCDPLAPEKAATTHPAIVKEVIALVKGAGGTPVVGELAAGNTPNRTKECLKVCGIEIVCRETETRLINFQEGGYIAKNIKDYKVLEKTDFVEAISSVQGIISLPKLKTHGLTYLTGAVKNFFGCVHPEEREFLHHSNTDMFTDGIIDIYAHLKPRIRLNILDAVISMEGDEGPAYGEPRVTSYVIASSDAVAVDVAAAKLTNHDPMRIPTIKKAIGRKLSVPIAKMKFMGDAITPCENFVQHSNYLNEVAGHKAILQPRITDRCVKCGACFQSCPHGAIYEAPNQYKINEQACAQCYCCQEVCAHGAIECYEKPMQQWRIVNLRLGLTCNQDCLFCTIADDNDKTLTTAEAKQKLKSILEDGIDEVTFTGGEPTIRDDLPELFSMVQAKGVRIDLQSNGVRLADNAYLKKLVDNGLVGVLIALHSHHADVSNKLTKTELFEKTVQGIRNCVKHKLKVSISHVINSMNYKELTDFIRFITGISRSIHVYLSFLRPNGTTRHNSWIVPKLVDIERYLYDAMAYCENNNISYSVEGVPLCYMCDFEHRNEESRRMFRVPQRYTGKGSTQHEDFTRFVNTELKAKAADCKHCALNSLCPGVWREYSELHGTSELFPVFHKVKWQT